MTRSSKVELRRRIRTRLGGLNDAQRAAAATTVCALLKRLLPEPAGEAMLGYLPLPGEVDIMACLQRWLDGGGRLGVPVVDWSAGTMEAGRLTGLDEACLRTGPHGVREPAAGDAIPLAALGVVLVPGLAFDDAGRRLGRGGGFYDRLLAELPAETRRIGVCFDEQRVDVIPVEQHDQCVDVVVTPAEIVQAR